MSGYVELVFNLPVDRSFTYRNAFDLEIGCRVSAPLGGRSEAGFVVGLPEGPPRDDLSLKSVARLIDREPLFNTDYLDLARWVAGMYYSSLGEALFAMIPGGRRESEAPALALDQDERPAVALSDEQAAAVEAICSEPGGSSYVYGVTGSGKTEVFLRVAGRTLEEGRSVIYLVPEIALTAQVIDAIRERFGQSAAILHSRLSPSQRLSEWRRILRGEAALVVGARSAVFAPAPRLGLIVVDEEHEGSYKSGNSPRYHARQVAMRRCALAGARLVLGSATPSVEAFHMIRSGRLRNLRLTRRLSGGSLPAIDVVRLRPADGVFSPRLCEEILATHRLGKQTILFLNRRGFSHFFRCNTCGGEHLCRRCSVGMTYHKQRNRMVCHYCGAVGPPLESCPLCGSLDVSYAGFGTERIEEEAARLFPELSTARLDADAVRKKGSLERVLESFRCGSIDMLLGTQMVAKGLNFAGVRLVGIVLADTGLHLPDFRAAERTFALIVQVAGRAGRFSADGRVVIQTYAPENEAIRCAAEGREAEFYERELDTRRELGFPPYGRLFRFVLRGREGRSVPSSAVRLAQALEGRLGGLAEVLGPAECPLGMIAGHYRRQILVRTTSFGAVHAAVAAVLGEYKPAAGVRLEVDVDPVSLL